MSRVANSPITLPKGVDVTLAGHAVSVKGPKGTLQLTLHRDVAVNQEANVLMVAPANAEADALGGTMRALIANMISGVTQGFERKLTLIGVGYRAQMKGQALALTLGFSHPVEFPVPAGITIETPSQTEIIVKGMDKQQVGQVAAKIRAFRPPEVYKGKGVRYANEVVELKETKKK